jgi:hypothetical protein
MLFAGLPETNWQDFFYTTVAEISVPTKALYRWLSDQ